MKVWTKVEDGNPSEQGQYLVKIFQYRNEAARKKYGYKIIVHLDTYQPKFGGFLHCSEKSNPVQEWAEIPK